MARFRLSGLTGNGRGGTVRRPPATTTDGEWGDISRPAEPMESGGDKRSSCGDRLTYEEAGDVPEKEEAGEEPLKQPPGYSSRSEAGGVAGAK